MALKPCRACKKEVSTDARTCPNCGAKWPTRKTGQSFMADVWGFGALCVVIYELFRHLVQ